jgi:hypothetical protein
MFNFVSLATFNNILNEYVDSLPSNRQAKALITQELVENIKNILLNQESTNDSQFRHWARQHFSILTINNTTQIVDKTEY